MIHILDTELIQDVLSALDYSILKIEQRVVNEIQIEVILIHVLREKIIKESQAENALLWKYNRVKTTPWYSSRHWFWLF